MEDIIGALISDWFDAGHRDLPWRRTRDPYRIWVSEVMLQQTRVETVRDYYARFLERFPTVDALACAERDEVMAVWQGLGYYRRADNLKKGAAYVHTALQGQFPHTREGLLEVPGIGDYTAGAIASFAFGLPEPAVDGNVMRVVSRLFALDAPIDTPAAKRDVTDRVRRMIPAGRAWSHNQGLMELGAVVCLPKGPRCEECPVRNLCQAYERDLVEILPRKNPKKKQTVVRRAVLLVTCGAAVLLHRRPEEGLLAGLWEFPGYDEGEDNPLAAQGWGPDTLRPVGSARHVFTHRIWQMEGYWGQAEAAVDLGPDYRWQPLDRLEEVAIPTALRAYREWLMGEGQLSLV